jgi:glycopeptide antibiotics resistance protein
MINLLHLKYQKWVIRLSYTLFCIYIMIASVLLFFSPYRQAAYEINSTGTNPYNLVPFKTIGNYIKASSHINQDIWITNLFGNVLAFLPLGFFLPLLFIRINGFWKTLGAVFITTASVEIIQFMTKVGSFDIDDIILNTLGGALGYLIFKMIFSILRKKGRIT